MGTSNDVIKRNVIPGDIEEVVTINNQLELLLGKMVLLIVGNILECF